MSMFELVANNWDQLLAPYTIGGTIVAVGNMLFVGMAPGFGVLVIAWLPAGRILYRSSTMYDGLDSEGGRSDDSDDNGAS